MFVTFLIFSLTQLNLFAQETIVVQGIPLAPENDFSIDAGENFSLQEQSLNQPNMSAIKGTNKTRFIKVRGIGKHEQFTPLNRNYHQYFVDEIDYSDYPQAFDQFAYQTGINYGPSLRGAGGATLKATPVQKSKQSNIQAEVETGSFDLFSQKANFYERYNNSQTINLSLKRLKEDGVYQNRFLNRDDTNNRDEFFLRSELTQTPFKNHQLKYRFHYNYLNNGYDAFVQDNTTVMNSDRPGQDDLTMQVHQLELASFSSNRLFLEYMKSHALYSYDEDWGNNQQWLNTESFNSTYDYYTEFISNRDRFSIYDLFSYKDYHLESRLSQSKLTHRERGFNEQNIRKDIQTILREQKVEFLGQKDFSIGEWGNLQVGLGFQNIKTTMSDQLEQSTLNQQLYNGLLKLEYKNFFISASTSEIPGGINLQSIIPDDRKNYKKERISSLETGIQSKGRNSYHLNFFYTLRDNPQTKTSFQSDPGDPSTFAYFKDNTDSAKHYGLELQNNHEIVSWLSFKSSVGLLKTSFGSYPFGERNLENREISNSPEYQFTLTPSLRLTKNLDLTAEFYQQDNFYFSNSHDEMGDGFSLVNLHSSIKFKNTRIKLGIDNLFNEQYATRGFFFGNTPPFFNEQLYTQLGSPRIYRLNLAIKL